MKLISLFLCLMALDLSAQTLILPSNDDIIRYGGSNSYNSRLLLEHYKRDLIPTKIKFENTATFQKINIFVKNNGNVRFEGEAARTVEIKINDKIFPALLTLPIEPSEVSTLIVFSTDPLLSHCEEIKIEIDTDHSALQIGNGVNANDLANLVAFEIGQIPLCF